MVKNENSKGEQMKNIIIIGAGPAGLTAAYELLKSGADYSITILEESDTVGGISRTVKYKNMRMDIGGHRFFSKDDRVTEWWQNMMPIQGALSFDDELLGRKRELSPTGPDPKTEDRVMLKRNRVSRIYYLKKFFDYPISATPKTFINLGFLKTMKAGFGYLGSCVKKLPEDSLENFYINRFGRPLYSMFFEGYTTKLWGRHPSEISADWGAQRVKGLSVTAVIKDVLSKLVPSKDRKVETSLIEEFLYPKFGPGQLWEITAAEIEKMGGKILYNSKVIAVDNGETEIHGVTYENRGGCCEIKCDALFSTMPLKDLIKGMKNVPVDSQRIAEGLPYRDFVTIGVLVDKLKIVNKTRMKTLGDIVPDCWIYVQDTGVKLGRIQIFNNWSPYMLQNPEKQVWIGLEYFCNEGDAFWNMADDERVKDAAKELVKMGVLGNETDIKDYHVEKVKKAYPAYFDTYDEIHKLVDYLNKYKNLYCIGRNGQHRYNNMDHSMATAFEAVKVLNSGIDDKTDIWNVNTEKEYHEEK